MAAVAVPHPIAPRRSPSPTPPLTPVISIDDVAPTVSRPVPVPNKHIPVCPTGPSPAEKPDTPPASPPTKHANLPPNSLLFPPDRYEKISRGPYKIYKLEAADLAAACEHLARQPLPEPSLVFPWLHGLHPNNNIQQAFFVARRKALRKTPTCLRGITIIKADGDMAVSKLKGAIAPEELFENCEIGVFREVDPKEGFSVRNFQIQAAKFGMLSDIVIYGENEQEVQQLAVRAAAAQEAWIEHHESTNQEIPRYNTFICTAPFRTFEYDHPEIVAVDSRRRLNALVMDFFHRERVEMCTMSKASEISNNVWLGPTPDMTIEESLPSPDEKPYDIYIECSDLGRLNPLALRDLADGTHETDKTPAYIDFPSSGSIMPPIWSHAEADGILETCKWIYNLAHGISAQASDEAELDEDNDTLMSSHAETLSIRPRKILIHCTDGYTETTMLALAYFSFSCGLPIPEAWIQLHTTKKRNFFSYPSDVALLTTLSPRLLAESPSLKAQGKSLSDISEMVKNEPAWLQGMDGSLPSRITDYMYLGNLGHANNPELLRQIGIGQLLSVGETASWREAESQCWGENNIMLVQGVQDNGVDALTEEFERCLEFIERGRQRNTATLVHCRVGVSRSATICIAEIMRAQNLSFPRAYCYVRARRLNVIIQPHLRFSYELLKREEELCRKRGAQVKRELEWPEIAREIAAMNKPYSR